MIRLGTAGSPATSTLKGIKIIADSGLQTMEVEFVRGVKMSNSTAKEVGKAAKDYNIKLSVHAPYYINLNSEEKAKITASIKRILQSCERAHYLKAQYVVFHPAYYGKREKEETFNNVKKAMLEMQAAIKKKRWKVKLAPETTGKVNVFGSIEETLRLVKETKCSFCVDFAHIKARQGSINYSKVLKQFPKQMHCHFSGIEYTKKGERRHILTSKKETIELAKAILKRKANATIINESPDPLKDSLMAKKVFESLGYNFEKNKYY